MPNGSSLFSISSISLSRSPTLGLAPKQEQDRRARDEAYLVSAAQKQAPHRANCSLMLM